MKITHMLGMAAIAYCVTLQPCMAAPPTNEQIGDYRGYTTTYVSYYDSAKTIKLKSSALVNIRNHSTWLFVMGPNNNYLNGEGTTNYGPYHAVYVGPEGFNAQFTFKGTGKKATVTVNGLYTNPENQFTMRFSGKLKKLPE